jgi:BNR repeat-containing family member
VARSRLGSAVPVAALAAVLLGGIAFPGQAAALPLRQRELHPSGAWSWFGDPRAIHHQGTHNRTYVSWVSSAGDVQVASYDHDTAVRVVTTLKARFQVDDHANPSLLVRPDGHLLAFWSAHAGGTLFYRRSANPEDVTSWGPQHTVPTNTAGPWGYTYPNPVQLSAEGDRIWLFWRGGNFNPTFSTSADGSSWAPARTLIRVPGQRPYVKYASDGVGTIHLAFTEAHPHNLATSIYYARYQAGSFYRADGSLIEPVGALPFTPAQASRIYNAAAHNGVRAWVHDVAVDGAGQPIVVFATFPSNTDHRYRYARWTGTRWAVHEITRAGGSMSVGPTQPNYSGGITLDHEDPSVVYLARQRGGVFQVERWQTGDGGGTWTSRPVSGGGRGNYRPISPRGMTDADLDIVWMRGGYPGYTRYQTAVDVEALSHDAHSPAAVAPASRQLEVLAADGTGGLIRKSYAGGWMGWEETGSGPDGNRLGRPAVASLAAGRLDVFAVDQVTGHLLQRTRENGIWGGWEDRGGGPDGHGVTTPAATSRGPGRLDVVARDTVTAELLQWWFDGSWHGPARVAPTPGGAFVPSIAAWGPNRLDVFAITDRGRLAHAWFSGRWHAWESLGAGPGGVAYKGPAAVASWGFRRLDVFAATSGGRTLAHRWFDGVGADAWRGPQTLPTGTGPDRAPLAGMAATSWAPRRLDVFSTHAGTHGLLQTWFSGDRWHGPARLDFAGSAVAVLADPNPRTTPIPVDPRILNLPGGD